MTATHRKMEDVSGPGVSTRMKIGRAAVAVLLVAVFALYLAPRVWNLTATPYRLDKAVEHADNYNPALHRVVEHEKVTLTAFDALDSMKESLNDVLEVDAFVAKELDVLIAQIGEDLHQTLDTAKVSVGDLVVSLNTLSGRIESLQKPSDGAEAALTANRVELQDILDDAASTAALVHDARNSAESSADDLSGKRYP